MAGTLPKSQFHFVELDSLQKNLKNDYDGYREALGVVSLGFQGHLHRYMCVRIAGFLEQSCFIVVRALVSRHSGPVAESFALSFFRNSPNLTPTAFEKLWLRFDAEDRWDVTAFLDQGDRRQILGALMRIRNDSSHGKDYQGGRMQVDTYMELADEIFDWMLEKIT